RDARREGDTVGERSIGGLRYAIDRSQQLPGRAVRIVAPHRLVGDGHPGLAQRLAAVPRAVVTSLAVHPQGLELATIDRVGNEAAVGAGMAEPQQHPDQRPGGRERTILVARRVTASVAHVASLAGLRI